MTSATTALAVGSLPGAPAVENHVADGVAPDHDAVEHVIDVRQKAGAGQNHGGHDGVQPSIRLLLRRAMSLITPSMAAA